MKIKAFAILESTNDWCLEHANELDTPHWVITREQTHGRGRMGRTWLACEGNLLTSFINNWEGTYDALLSLSPMIGLAIASFIKTAYHRDIQLKWPNDLYYNQAKVGGILIETKPNKPNGFYVVIGIGLNLKGCETFTGLDIDESSDDFLQNLAPTIEKKFSEWVMSPTLDSQAWNELDLFANQQLQVIQADNSYNATAIGVDKQGCYWVKTTTGQIVKINNLSTSIRRI